MPTAKRAKTKPHTEAEKKALGATLTAARKRAELSLDAVAMALKQEYGVELVKATIGHWHTGQNVPDALWLKRLSALYETSADMLLGNEPAPTTWPFSRELLEVVRELDAEEIHEVENSLWAALHTTPPAHVTSALAEARKRRARKQGIGVMDDNSQRVHPDSQSR